MTAIGLFKCILIGSTMLNQITILGRTTVALAKKTKRAALLFLKTGATIMFVSSLSACSSLGILNALTPHDAAVHAVKDMPYGESERQKLDIYIPSRSAKPVPVVVFFYGGEWVSGDRADYAFIGRALAGRGMMTVVADYRLYPEVSYPRFLEDAALAVAWTSRQASKYGGDPDQLFVMGHSAGAYNAAMVALDERWLGRYGLTPGVIRGWIGLAGPYDFLPITNRTVQPIFFHPDTPPESQPITHVEPGAPPALLIAAEDDAVVNPIRNTGGLAERLRKNDVPVEEIYFDRVGHATLIASLSAPLRMLAPTLDVIERFVRAQGAPDISQREQPSQATR